MKKFDWLILICILLLGFVLRMYKINRPVADWHSWRQADTAAVTRRYYQEGIDLLHPQYDDLSSIPSGLDNPDGYRMVEFPFINALIAFTYTFFDWGYDLITYMRLFSAIISLGSGALIFILIRQLSSRTAAFFSALTFLTLPYNLFYSTTILPEVPLVFFTILSVFLWVKYCQSQSIKYLFSFIFSFSLSLLLKPIAILIAPALFYFYIKHNKFSKLFHPLQLTVLISFSPLIFWRNWIQQYPAGIPAYTWLFNSTKIRFTGAFFRWLFAERFGKLILGFWGTFLLGIGITFRPSKKIGWMLHYWLFGIVCYLFIFATGNVTHDYYQIISVPVISIFIGLGIDQIISNKTIFHPFTKYIFLIASYMFMLAFSWFFIRDFYNINNPNIVLAGKAANQILPKSAKVVAPYGGDTAFLFQTNRQGWPIGGGIRDRIAQGATHYVTVNHDEEAQLLIEKCHLLSQADNYIIIEITGCQF